MLDFFWALGLYLLKLFKAYQIPVCKKAIMSSKAVEHAKFFRFWDGKLSCHVVQSEDILDHGDQVKPSD